MRRSRTRVAGCATLPEGCSTHTATRPPAMQVRSPSACTRARRERQAFTIATLRPRSRATALGRCPRWVTEIAHGYALPRLGSTAARRRRSYRELPGRVTAIELDAIARLTRHSPRGALSGQRPRRPAASSRARVSAPSSSRFTSTHPAPFESTNALVIPPLTAGTALVILAQVEVPLSDRGMVDDVHAQNQRQWGWVRDRFCGPWDWWSASRGLASVPRFEAVAILTAELAHWAKVRAAAGAHAHGDLRVGERR